MEPEQPEEPAIDIEAYASSYSGNAKINRLIFIAEKTSDSALALSALRIAADDIKRGHNISKYNEVISKINNRLGPDYHYDREWADGLEARAQATQYKLESELSGYKTNLIKESIRMGHHELADFFFSRGDPQSAFKSYVRSRDYCTTAKHVINMCLSVIRCAVELGNFVHVNTYVAKGEQSPEAAKDPVITSKLKAAGGLASLDNKKYKIAAKKFSEVSSELGSSFNDVIAAQDVALYGGLCALASFDRPDLRRHIVDNISFRELLELNPEVRELVYDFYGSRYAACLARLQRLLPLLRMDMYLSKHVDTLYAAVRSKALIQYTAPFVSVNLQTMAQAFGTEVGALEKELADLVAAGQVQARIDSHSKVLYARLTNTRAATFERALQTGEDYLRDTRALLLRASLMQHDLVQRAPAGQGMRGPRAPAVGDRFGDRMFF
ncbi:g4936 [Coccomyxa elongata]